MTIYLSLHRLSTTWRHIIIPTIYSIAVIFLRQKFHFPDTEYYTKFACVYDLTPIGRCSAENIIFILIVDATPEVELLWLSALRLHIYRIHIGYWCSSARH